MKVIEEIAKMQKEGIMLKKPKSNPKIIASDPSTWRARCSECGNKNMTFNERRFAYYCSRCGNVLEV